MTTLLHQRTPAAWDNDDQTLEIVAPSWRAAYQTCMRVAGRAGVAYVTPQILADAESFAIHCGSPLALVAAPSQFELCEVRADGQLGRCILVVHIAPLGVLP